MDFISILNGPMSHLQTPPKLHSTHLPRLGFKQWWLHLPQASTTPCSLTQVPPITFLTIMKNSPTHNLIKAKTRSLLQMVSSYPSHILVLSIFIPLIDPFNCKTYSMFVFPNFVLTTHTLNFILMSFLLRIRIQRRLLQGTIEHSLYKFPSTTFGSPSTHSLSSYSHG